MARPPVRPDVAAPGLGPRVTLALLVVLTISAAAASAQTVAVVTPNGGERFASLETVEIAWSTGSVILMPSVRISYRIAGSPPVTIAASTPNDGSFAWTIPALGTKLIKVLVEDALDGLPADSSDAVFEVCPSLTFLGDYGSFAFPSELAAGDFDEDGILDLAVAASTGLVILPGTGSAGGGNGGFGTGTTYPNAGTRSVAVDDYNDDGRLDAAVAAGDSVIVYLGNGTGTTGDGTLTRWVAYAIGPFVNRVAAADFDENGILDLAVIERSAARIAILLGRGSGGVGNGLFGAPAFYAVGAIPSDLEVGDWNNDHVLDLVVINEDDGSFSWLRGNGGAGVGDGTFAAAVATATVFSPRGLASGDFDEDGNDDLAITGVGGTQVLFGDGSGGFAPDSTYDVAGLDVVVADVIGDGRLDLVVADNDRSGLTLMAGHGAGSVGDGTFTVGGSLTGMAGPLRVIVGDFAESSSSPDFVVGSAYGMNVGSVAGGCLTGSFAIGVSSPAGGEVWVDGTTETLSWTRANTIPAVDLQISRDGGLNWETIARRLSKTTYPWRVVRPFSTAARARVVDVQSQNHRGQSPANFTIADPTVEVEDLGEGAGGLALSRPWPNPAKGAITLRLDLPRADRVDVAVFDPQGRRVATLARGLWSRGSRRLTWGGAAPAGVYVVRARCGASETAQTFVIRP